MPQAMISLVEFCSNTSRRTLNEKNRGSMQMMMTTSSTKQSVIVLSIKNRFILLAVLFAVSILQPLS